MNTCLVVLKILMSPESEAEYSEDELESVPAEEKTKDGYLKDGFVVDTNEDSSDRR